MRYKIPELKRPSSGETVLPSYNYFADFHFNTSVIQGRPPISPSSLSLSPHYLSLISISPPLYLPLLSISPSSFSRCGIFLGGLSINLCFSSPPLPAEHLFSFALPLPPPPYLNNYLSDIRLSCFPHLLRCVSRIHGTSLFFNRK